MTALINKNETDKTFSEAIKENALYYRKKYQSTVNYTNKQFDIFGNTLITITNISFGFTATFINQFFTNFEVTLTEK